MVGNSPCGECRLRVEQTTYGGVCPGPLVTVKGVDFATRAGLGHPANHPWFPLRLVLVAAARDCRARGRAEALG